MRRRGAAAAEGPSSDLGSPQIDTTGNTDDAGLPALECRVVLQQGQLPVHVAKFSANGEYIISGGADRAVSIWNPYRDESSGYFIASLKGVHGYDVLDVAISSDSQRIVSVGGDRAGMVWDVATGTLVTQLRGHLDKITSVALTGNDNLIVTGSSDKTLRIWDVRIGAWKGGQKSAAEQAAESSSKPNSHRPSTYAVQTIADAADSITGVECVRSSTEILCVSSDGCAYAYDARQMTRTCDHMGESLVAIAVNRDGEGAALQGLDSSIRLLDRTNGTVLKTYKGHLCDRYPTRCTFSPDESQIVTGSQDGVVRFYDLLTGKVVRAVNTWEAIRPSSEEVQGTMRAGRPVHYGPVVSVATHDRNSALLTASHGGSIALWQPRDG